MVKALFVLISGIYSCTGSSASAPWQVYDALAYTPHAAVGSEKKKNRSLVLNPMLTIVSGAGFQGLILTVME